MILLGLILALSLLALPAYLAGYAIHFVRRARRRNAGQRCGQCVGPLYAAPTYAPPTVVHGLQLCSPCAHRSRHLLPAALGAAAGFMAMAVFGGMAIASTAALGPASALAPQLLLLEYGVVLGGAVLWMKRQGREERRPGTVRR